MSVRKVAHFMNHIDERTYYKIGLSNMNNKKSIV